MKANLRCRVRRLAKDLCLNEVQTAMALILYDVNGVDSAEGFINKVVRYRANCGAVDNGTQHTLYAIRPLLEIIGRAGEKQNEDENFMVSRVS